MKCHCTLVCTAALLFGAPLAASSNGRTTATLQGKQPSAAATSDYIFVDGFELPADCSPALSCPLPQTGKSCISGRLTAAGSGMPLRASFNADRTCDNGAVGGACDLTVTPHDTVQFVVNPSASPPLTSAGMTIDGCGRFRFVDLDPPGSGSVAIVAEDADPAPESDLYAPTATFHALGTNEVIDDITAVATRHDTVDQWTQSAGSPFGASSFSDVGVILLTFVDASGFPQDGVTVTQNGSVFPTQDYYFSDASLIQRYNIDNLLESTGLNGSALFANGAFTDYSGVGAEMGCVRPSVLATSIPGMIVFVEIRC